MGGSTHNNHNVRCGCLRVTDGIWKFVFPHYMFRVEVIDTIASINFIKDISPLELCWCYTKFENTRCMYSLTPKRASILSSPHSKGSS